MSNFSREQNKRVNLCIATFELSVKEFLTAEEEVSRQYHWGGILKNYRNAAAALIGPAMRLNETRGIASRLKAEQARDPILNYLLFSRNKDDHVDDAEPLFVARTNPEHLDFGGAIRIDIPSSGSGKIIFSHSIIDGVPVDNMGISFGEEKLQIFGRPTNLPVKHNAEMFELLPVFTKKGTEIPVPLLDGKTAVDTSHAFAKHALDWVIEGRKRILEALGES